jgi:hypothetical protein
VTANVTDEKIDVDIDPPLGEGPSTDIVAAARLLLPVVALLVMEGRFSFSRSTKSYGPFDDADRQFIAEAWHTTKKPLTRQSATPVAN